MGLDALSVALLNSYLGHNIGEICGLGFTDPTLNHCAHFVNHVLQLGFGATCGPLSHGGRNIRVHETFAQCPVVGRFDALASESALIFVLAPGNVNLRAHEMDNVRKKHVGIYLNGTLWHYSNTQYRVITETPGEFIHHYPDQTNELFYGRFPSRSAPIPFGGSGG
jgi:hypothetical protein